MGPVTLPPAADSQPLVQLCWKYYAIPNGATGARPELSVGDIRVNASRKAPVLTRVSLTADGLLHAEFAGAPGTVVTLLTSANLVDWEPTQLLTPGQDGEIRFEVPVQDAIPRAFYRLQVADP